MQVPHSLPGEAKERSGSAAQGLNDLQAHHAGQRKSMTRSMGKVTMPSMPRAEVQHIFAP